MGVDLVKHGCTLRSQDYVRLNSFHSNTHGRSVQLTIHKEYVHMTFKEAVDLFQTCIAEIQKLDDAYNRNPPWWEELNLRRERADYLKDTILENMVRTPEKGDRVGLTSFRTEVKALIPKRAYDAMFLSYADYEDTIAEALKKIEEMRKKGRCH